MALADGDHGPATPPAWAWLAAGAACVVASVALVRGLGPVVARALGVPAASGLVSAVAVSVLTATTLCLVARRWLVRRAVEGEAAVLRASTAAAEAQRRELARMRQTFLTSISHELRTPLSNLSLGAATIKEHHGVLPPELSAEVAERMMANAQRLEGLLLDLLELGGGAGSSLVRPGAPPVDVGALVRQAAEQVRAGGRACRAVVEVDPVSVRVDRALVRRILTELVLNVVRHTPRGTSATVAARVRRGFLSLVVEDDGPGIDAPLRDGVPEPFVQGGGVAGMPSPGLGIGLSLVAHHARQHGGELLVASGERGTRVEVRLPVLPGDDAVAEHPVAS